MKNILKGLFVIIILTLSALAARQSYIEHHASVKDGSQIILSTGDERYEVNSSGVKWGIVLELKPFGDRFLQDILIARVRMKDGPSDTGIEKVAFVAQSEGVHVGERVIVHSFSQKHNRGFNYTMIVTKDRDTNAPALW